MPAPRDARPASPVVAGVLLVAATYGLARFGYGLTLPAIRADLHLSGSVAGAVASGGFVVYCAAVALSALLVRRGRARTAIGLAGATGALGALGVAAAPGPAALAAGVLVAGSSGGLASPALVEVVARAVHAERRDRAQAVVNAGTGLGVLVLGGGVAFVLSAGVAVLGCAPALRVTASGSVRPLRPRRAT